MIIIYNIFYRMRNFTPKRHKSLAENFRVPGSIKNAGKLHYTNCAQAILISYLAELIKVLR